jgi:tetratricopeptide (TPR) repeat protein
MQQPGEPLKRIRKKKKTEKPARQEKPEKPLFDPNRNKRIARNIAKVVGGFIFGLMVSVVVYLMLPEPEPVQLPPKQEEIDAAVNAAKEKFDQEYNALKVKYEAAQKDREDALKQTDYYKAAIRIYEVESMVNAKEYESAADMLMLMKTIEFRDAEKEKFDSLYEKVMPLAAKSAYDRGIKNYNSRKYQEALKDLEKVRIYDPEYSKMDAALYYMGRSHQLLKDSRNALALYQEILDNYPSGAYVKSAKQRINELTRVP